MNVNKKMTIKVSQLKTNLKVSSTSLKGNIFNQKRLDSCKYLSPIILWFIILNIITDSFIELGNFDCFFQRKIVFKLQMEDSSKNLEWCKWVESHQAIKLRRGTNFFQLLCWQLRRFFLAWEGQHVQKMVTFHSC